ncbi:MAG: helix-turn-helix transcriptional regulator [Rhizobiaceae bacterium]
MRSTTKDTERDVEFGRRIRLRREHMKMSVPELAARVGVTYRQIVNYETGSASIRASTLEAIAGALEVPLPYFFSAPGTDPIAETFPLGALNCAQKLLSIMDEETRQDLLVLVNHLATDPDKGRARTNR